MHVKRNIRPAENPKLSRVPPVKPAGGVVQNAAPASPTARNPTFLTSAPSSGSFNFIVVSGLPTSSDMRHAQWVRILFVV